MTQSFSAAVARWGIDALVRVDQVRRASALELFSLVIDATPVDTGRLRGNWQVSINSPVTSETSRLDKSGGLAKAEALANLGSLVDIVYMTNNLPYVEAIEFDGHSAQAPSGMFRLSVMRWEEIVKKKAQAYGAG